jgi:hypothetical protein
MMGEHGPMVFIGAMAVLFLIILILYIVKWTGYDAAAMTWVGFTVSTVGLLSMGAAAYAQHKKNQKKVLSNVLSEVVEMTSAPGSAVDTTNDL